MKLHEKLKEALAPFVGKENCEENREKIIELVLDVLPGSSRVDAEIAAVGILGDSNEAQEKPEEKN